jgi:hypothetical protein
MTATKPKVFVEQWASLKGGQIRPITTVSGNQHCTLHLGNAPRPRCSDQSTRATA